MRVSPWFFTLAVSLASSSFSSARASTNASAFLASSSSSARTTSTTISSIGTTIMTDPVYPGTAVERMNTARERVRQLAAENALGGIPWEDARKKILWAGGLRDLPDARPGQGYTGHSFNDFNHVDLTCMLDQVSNNENDGSVKGIMRGNQLGPGIRIASLPELGPGGSWSTCAMGCNKEPPQDVAHVQFQARIAFKLVWVPNEHFDSFVLVDDDGNMLASGKDLTELPPLRERQMNYQIVAGSKYARVADMIARNVAAE